MGTPLYKSSVPLSVTFDGHRTGYPVTKEQYIGSVVTGGLGVEKTSVGTCAEIPTADASTMITEKSLFRILVLLYPFK
jgi:hypothetical protein